jgi:competence protein ComEC
VRAIAAVPAAGLLAGSTVGVVVSGPPFVVGAVLLVTSLAVAVSAWRTSKPVVLASAVGVGFFIGGAMLSASAWRAAWRPTLRVAFEEIAREQRVRARLEGRRLPEDDDAFAFVTGALVADAAATASGVALHMEVDSIAAGSAAAGAPGAKTVSGGVQLTVVGALAAERLGEWRAGRRVRLPAQLRRPSRYLDVGVPDYERLLGRRGATLVGTVKSGALVEVLQRGGPVDEATAAIRAYARRALTRAVGSWSRRSGSIVTAIVIGDRTGLEEDVERRLQEAGTFHVIAISGGNVAILAGLLLTAFRFGGVLGRGAMLSAIGLLIGYARLVGGGSSVDRATFMAVLHFGARAMDQRAPPLNALAVSAACLVTCQPLSASDPAFILTFGAAFGIILIVPLVRDAHLPTSLEWAASMFAASVAAEVMLMPVGASAFSRVTFAGLVLNFAAVPFMGVAQIAGMAVVPAALVSPHLASAIGLAAHLGAAGLIWTSDLVRLVPAVTFRVAPPGWFALACYYAAIGSMCVCWRRSQLRRGAAAVLVLAGFWIVAEPWSLAAQRGDGRMHVAFLDVGQGEATVVRFPRGATLLVDAGGSPGPSTFDIGDRIVAPVLRAAGVKRLDVLALTHGDPDHIGGALSVVREFRPREVWEGIPVPPFEPLRALRMEAGAVHARWSNVKLGDTAQFDGVNVVVRHPDVPDWERQRVRNDDSIVLELNWGQVSIWLTGDIGKAVERTLLAGIRTAPIRVVKVPHHGSLTSSTTEFVRALAPRVAIVSAGRSNHFGHPVPEVLERYRDAGAEVFRTDQDGAVTVETDGTSVDVRTYLGRRFFVTTPAHHEAAKDVKEPNHQSLESPFESARH